MIKQQVTVTDVSSVKKELAIEVAAEEVKTAFAHVYEGFARQARVPGFRPGKAPLNIIKQRFASDVREEVISRLVPHALEHALHDHQLRVVGEPELNPDDIQLSEGQPLQFKARVEIFPEFELQDYKGIKATKRVRIVGDEDVDAVIERWRNSAMELVPVAERGAALGDVVSVNLIGKFVEPTNDFEKEDMVSDGVEIELGAEGVQAEFNEQLTDVREQDVREFRVNYPADFTSAGLAGKSVDFQATVTAVRKRELPELNDEFAKQFGEYDSLAVLREKLKADLEARAEHEAQEQVRREVLDAVIAQYNFDLPETLLRQQANERLRTFVEQLRQSRLPKEYLEQIDWPTRIAQINEQAERDLRAALIVGRIGRDEKISISDAELDEEVAAIAEAQRQSVEDMRATLTKEDALPSIEYQLNYNKTLDHIVQAADVTTKQVTAAELEAEARAAAQAAETAQTEEHPTPESQSATENTTE